MTERPGGPVHVDGSVGEGGGQIIRTSLTLAAVTGRPLEIVQIRAKRSRPGLLAQHLTAVRAAAALCDASVAGAEPGSSRLLFAPRRPVAAGDRAFAIGTAGATALVAQTVLPALAPAGGGRLVVEGGTHVPAAPTADYMAEVYAPALMAAGLPVGVAMARPGFYPKGGGRLVVDVGAGRPAPLVREDRGALVRLGARVLTSRLPTHVGARGEAALRQGLAGLPVEAVVEVVEAPAASPGAAVLVYGETEAGPFGFSALGDRGQPMEAVVAEAVRDFRAWLDHGAACDPHLADQLVPVLALAGGESRWTTWPVTEHLRTVLGVVAAFLDVDARVEETPDGAGRVVLSPR